MRIKGSVFVLVQFQLSAGVHKSLSLQKEKTLVDRLSQ